MAAYRTWPTTSKMSGDDYRVMARDASDEDFHASAYVRKEPTSIALVEVQAFRASTSGGGFRQFANVSLLVDAGIGSADVRLSPDEARAVAEMLVIAARDAEQLTWAASNPEVAHLNDAGDDTDGVDPRYIASRS